MLEITVNNPSAYANDEEEESLVLNKGVKVKEGKTEVEEVLLILNE